MRVASREAREKGERVKAATKETVLGWLASAVRSIEEKPTMVMYSFLVCGISNKLDDSQNDLICQDIPIERKDASDSSVSLCLKTVMTTRSSRVSARATSLPSLHLLMDW